MVGRRKLIFAGIGVFLFALVITVAILLWFLVLRERVYPKRFGVVCEGTIFRSGRIHEALLDDTLRKNNIRTIINLNGKDEHSKAEDDIADKCGIKVFYFTLNGSGICSAKEYAAVLRALDDSSKNNSAVLVHCSAGVNRTGATIVLYRILVRGDKPEEAYRELLAYGWRPSKNAQLVRHLNRNMKVIAEMLVAEGVIDKIPDPVPQIDMR